MHYRGNSFSRRLLMFAFMCRGQGRKIRHAARKDFLPEGCLVGLNIEERHRVSIIVIWLYLQRSLPKLKSSRGAGLFAGGAFSLPTGLCVGMSRFGSGIKYVGARRGFR